MEMNGTIPGNGYDQINVRGTVNLTGITLSASLGFASSVNDQFVIINNNDVEAPTGQFEGLPNNAEFYIGGQLFQINYAGGDGNDVVLSRVPTPPLPLLTIQHVPPASVRLLWSTNAEGFIFQFNAMLSSVRHSPRAVHFDVDRSKQLHRLQDEATQVLAITVASARPPKTGTRTSAIA